MIKKRLESQELKTICGGKDIVAVIDVRRECLPTGGPPGEVGIFVIIEIRVAEAFSAIPLAEIQRQNLTGNSCEL